MAAVDLRAVDTRLGDIEEDVSEVEAKISTIEQRTRDANGMLIALMVLYFLLLIVATIAGVMTFNKVTEVQTNVVSRGMDTLRNAFDAGKTYFSSEAGQRQVGNLRERAVRAFKKRKEIRARK